MLIYGGAMLSLTSGNQWECREANRHVYSFNLKKYSWTKLPDGPVGTIPCTSQIMLKGFGCCPE